MSRTKKPTPRNSRTATAVENTMEVCRGFFDPKTADDSERKIQAVIATDIPVVLFDPTRGPFGEAIDEILLVRGGIFPDRVPLLDSHNDHTVKGTMGSTREFTVQSRKVLAWNYFGQTPDALEAWMNVRDGHITDNSIHYGVRKFVYIEPGMTRKVEGKIYKAGPDRALRVVTSWKLINNSIVTHGADPGAFMRTKTEIRTMNEAQIKYIKARGFIPDELTEVQRSTMLTDYAAEVKRSQIKPTDVVAVDVGADRETGILAERKRVKDIREAARGDIPADVVQNCIDKGHDVAESNMVFLAHLRASRSQIGAPNLNLNAAQVKVSHLEIALVSRCRHISEKTMIRRYGEKDLEIAGREFRNLNLMDACRSALSLEGVTIPRATDEMIRAAYSTVALPKTLGLVANVSAMEGYLMARQSWRPWCRIGTVTDFKSHTRVRVTDAGDLKKVGNQGELEHGTKGEEFETVQADTYGKLFTVSRQDIRNDNLDSVTKTPQQFGAKANTKITDLVYTLLLANGNMSDGVALFHATHNNLITSNALASAGLAAAIKSFRNQTNLDGDPVDIDPAWLLVPPNLENTARGLLESDLLLLRGSTDADKPNSNIYKGALGLVVEPRMENSGFTGFSTTTWYLEADPGMNDTIEVAFLDGNEGPVVEQFDQVPSTLGRTYRVYVDVGVAALDFRTQNKNTA